MIIADAADGSDRLVYAGAATAAGTHVHKAAATLDQWKSESVRTFQSSLELNSEKFNEN